MPSPRASTGCSGQRCRQWLRSGQGTVEYAVVLAAVIAMVVGFGALWHFFDAGTPIAHALQSASHHLQSAAAGAIGDVFMY